MINFIFGSDDYYYRAILILQLLNFKKNLKVLNYLQSDFKQSSNDGNSISGKFYFSKNNNYRIELCQ